MGLEDNIAEAIIMALDELAGNPERAVKSALDCESVAQWTKQETTKLALIGGAEMVVPGLHAFTIPTGVSYLLHKLGYISWGIGALKGAFVIETEAYSDLRNILALWANEGQFDASIIEHLAVSLDALRWVMSEAGQAAMPDLLSASEDSATLRTYHILQKLAENFVAGDERGYSVAEAMLGAEAASQMLEAGRENVKHLNCEVMLTRPMGRKVGRRLASRLASRIGTRIPARMIVGFLPVAGAIANSFMNVQTIGSMASVAEKYYDRRLRLDHLQAAAS